MPSPPIDELQAWLSLMDAPGIGRRRAARLLRHFGGPCELFQAKAAEWSEVLEPELCAGLPRSWAQSAALLERSLTWLAQDPRHHIVTLGDSAYPSPLLHSPDPPLLLYTAGSCSLWHRPLVAIVGSRHATPQGLALARHFAQAISSADVPVVSGLALGIDAAAHEGALLGAAGTIGVLGCGIDQIYPSRHHNLADRLMDKGLLVSEYPLGMPAIKEHFPQRNRIIAWLSVSTVVVEAALRSGSLITARLAAEAGRDVLAIPGPLSSPQSAGCNWLIKQGAGLLEDVNDIWESAPRDFAGQIQCRAPAATALPRARGKPPKAKSSLSTEHMAQGDAPPGEEAARAARTTVPPGAVSLPRTTPRDGETSELKDRLQGGPVSLDELVEGSGRAATHWQQALLVAEFEGLVSRLPGGRYQWMGRPP